jgi:hypothetical protein
MAGVGGEVGGRLVSLPGWPDWAQWALQVARIVISVLLWAEDSDVQEASLISINARYIGDHQPAATWFAPYSPTGTRLSIGHWS